MRVSVMSVYRPDDAALLEHTLAVIVKKCNPFLGRITPAVNAPQVARDGPLGDHEAELLQFAMDFRRALFRVLLRQAPNRTRTSSVILGRPPWVPRFPTPIKPKSRPMPADDRCRLDNHEDIGPAGQKRRSVVYIAVGRTTKSLHRRRRLQNRPRARAEALVNCSRVLLVCFVKALNGFRRRFACEKVNGALICGTIK